MSKELIEQLRDLANCRHDDLSIDYEAADRIEQLETERDQLREQVKAMQSAIKVIEIDSDEVLDFDECTAMMIPMDAYHGLIEALAATEPKP